MDTAIVKILLLLCFNLICQVNSTLFPVPLKPEAYMTVPQLISTQGYPVEEHNVTTEDGYILTMHRIPGGLNAKGPDATGKGKRVVFIQHGLTGSSGDFVIMGPSRSLGYILADAGFDVWLGNCRGNVYSSHVSLTKEMPAFWEFSFHEHGKYDEPAMIDKVLEVTGMRKLLYVGYSMGTTSCFTMLAQRPEYNDKIVAFVALAPAVYFDNFRIRASVLLGWLNVPGLMRLHGKVSASMGPQLLEYMSSRVCTGHSISTFFCLNFIYSIFGISVQTDQSMLATTMYRLQPASWRELEHYGKIAMTGVFTSMEHGLWGAVKPYNLANVKVPVFLYYGGYDILNPLWQVKRLENELKKTNPNVQLIQATVYPQPQFNHLDFIYAKDLGNLFNRALSSTIRFTFDRYDSA